MHSEKGPREKASNPGLVREVKIRFWIAGIAWAMATRPGCARHLKDLDLARRGRNARYAKAVDMGRKHARVQVAATIARQLRKGRRA